MGRDFADVRAHTDGRAAASAQTVRASAFTVGRHIVFDAGRYQPGTPEGRRLLDHELAHVAQQGGRDPDGGEEIEVGAPTAAAEREAEAVAASAGPPVAPDRESGAGLGAVLRRQPVPGAVGWGPGSGANAKETAVKGVRRVPLKSLPGGHQFGTGNSGRAIVLLPPHLDETKPVDVLLNFHGHNRGDVDPGRGKVRDDAIENIEGQMDPAGRPQLMVVLPQGTTDSSFGTVTTGKDKAKVKVKAFDVNAYISNVLTVLAATENWKAPPTVARVMISGHSGAGELINEKLLGSELAKRGTLGKDATPTTGSALPAGNVAFKELALFDAVNGPKEHARLSEFLKGVLSDTLAAVQGLPTDTARLTYLASGFKFRAYYSHGPKIGNYYSQWYVGPVISPKAVYKESLQELIANFLQANAAALGGTTGSVYRAFEANFLVKDSGTIGHDEMVKANLKDAVSVLPKHAESGAAGPAAIPSAVRTALDSSGKPLGGSSRDWAEDHFGRDLSHVRVHDDALARESARAIRAQAYTFGPHIVFGHDRDAPGTEAGRRLLAHELAHVVQQGSMGMAAQDLRVGPAASALEAQADAAADREVARRLPGGVARPMIRRAPHPASPPTTVDAGMCEANKNPNPAPLGTCSYKEPAFCPTYEDWVGTFTALKTFPASDTPGSHPTSFSPIGDGAADTDFRPPRPGGGPPPPPKDFAPLKPGERFIDHPTDTWVQNCLPDTLRATAYQLPADCADIAIILRHVWLAAHHRTQKMGKYVLGDAAGKASERAVKDVITNVGTESVSRLVAPYSDAAGKPIRSFKALEPLLHPGDILVWWHYEHGFDKPRTGGHTHTIAAVNRDATGRITGLKVLQGNEPLFAKQKAEIHAFLTEEAAKDPKKHQRRQPTDKELGELPGRRIELTTDQDSGISFTDSVPETDKSPAPIWKWGTDTLLVVAGPPKSAIRPPAQSQKGDKGKPARRLTDWVPGLKTAPRAELVARFESMLFEARAVVESGGTLVEADARQVGAATGSRVWALGKAAKDLGNDSHFRVVQDILDILRSFIHSRPSAKAGTPVENITVKLTEQLGWIGQAFELAARGASDVNFATPAKGKTQAVNVLVTGFDPFDPTGSLKAPAAGRWNPSGAAALALDGKRLPVSSSTGVKGVAAVESVVLPVSFDAFSAGLVEQVVGAHAAKLDAVLTVSEDPGLDPSGPVRIERYAVGVHEVRGNLAGVPAAGAGGIGPAIVESSAPVKDIAAATKSTAKRGAPAVPEPMIGEEITFRFTSKAEAKRALVALGLKPVEETQVAISDEKALSQIMSTMTRRGDGPDIAFRVGRDIFSATVVSGPGGNFLSNEVSFRALRMLTGSAFAKSPVSFHTHTQRGDAIPDDDRTPKGAKDRAAAIAVAMGMRGRLIATLERMIAAVGRVALDRRAPKP